MNKININKLIYKLKCLDEHSLDLIISISIFLGNTDVWVPFYWREAKK